MLSRMHGIWHRLSGMLPGMGGHIDQRYATFFCFIVNQHKLILNLGYLRVYSATVRLEENREDGG